MSAFPSAEMKLGPLEENQISLFEVRMSLLLLSVLAEKSKSNEPSTKEEEEKNSESSLDETVENNGAVWSRDRRSWLDENAAAAAAWFDGDFESKTSSEVHVEFSAR